jgi:hypothetical protein
MEHSQYHHFLSRAREGANAMVLPVGDRNHVGCLPDQVRLTHALNKELDQAAKEIRRFSDQGVEASQRIVELEPLYKLHEETIAKMKQENTSMELRIQFHNELIGKIVAKMGLDKMGEDDNEDDDDEGDAVEDTAIAAPRDVTSKVVAEEEEDLEMLILEQESPEALEIILLDEEPEPLQPHPFIELMGEHEESPSRENDDLDEMIVG